MTLYNQLVGLCVVCSSNYNHWALYATDLRPISTPRNEMELKPFLIFCSNCRVPRHVPMSKSSLTWNNLHTNQTVVCYIKIPKKKKKKWSFKSTYESSLKLSHAGEDIYSHMYCCILWSFILKKTMWKYGPYFSTRNKIV